MSCYHPMAYGLAPAKFDIDFNTGEVIKQKLIPLGFWDPEKYKDDPSVYKIPCKKCLGCRLDYARGWADRMIYELQANDGKGIFVTLTYNNDHVPPAFNESGEFVGFTLDKRDLQLFFKRLRKYFSNHTIRFYASGEYGSATKTHRPHYHSIIFGIGLDDIPHCFENGMNELGQKYYRSDWFERTFWSTPRDHNDTYGRVCISEVSYKTCAYVARYVSKKSFGFEDPDFAQKEFVLMSRRPGIGLTYFGADSSNCNIVNNLDTFDVSKKYFSDQNGSVEVGIPSYFLKKLSLIAPEKYDKIMSDRKAYALDRDLLKLKNTSLSYIDKLEQEEDQLFNKTKILFNRREVNLIENCGF